MDIIEALCKNTLLYIGYLKPYMPIQMTSSDQNNYRVFREIEFIYLNTMKSPIQQC